MKTVIVTLAFLATASADVNLFATGDYYVNPVFQAELDSSIAVAADETTKANLVAMRDIGSAYWIDTKSKIYGINDTSTLEGILESASKISPSPLVVTIVYDLPNRDCYAKASNGEICCYENEDGTCDYTAGDDCTEGINDYKVNYIDKYADVVGKYAGSVPMAILIEPDSLPNLATNSGSSTCGNGATESAYKEGVKYAVTTIKGACDECELYLDAAHGGWLGWKSQLQTFVTIVSDLDIGDDLRGFSTNVANYQTIGLLCEEGYDCVQGDRSNPCCDDPCDILSQYNYGWNEANYARLLLDTWRTTTDDGSKHVIIDSGRNGVADMRSDCANWCNIRGAGIGYFPTTKTANESFIDAYYWLKTPGESDGCTESLPSASDPFTANGTCARYDSMCGSIDSLGSNSDEPYSPEAGNWFDYQIQMLAANAVFTSDDDTTPDGDDTPVSDDGSDDTANDDGNDDIPASDDGNDDTPASDDDSCVKDWQKCGGIDDDGNAYTLTCCTGTCKYKSKYYSQCKPIDIDM